MARKIATFLSLMLWITMMGYLYQRELRPTMEAYETPTYKDYFRDALNTKSRMLIYIGEKQVGFSQTEIVQPKGGTARIFNETNAEIQVPFLGKKTSIKSYMTINLNQDMGLDDFSLTLYSADFSAHISGIYEERDEEKNEDAKLVVTIDLGGEKIIQEYPFDPKEVLASSLTPINVTSHLKIGKKWNVRMLNPFTRKINIITMEVQGKQTIEYDGEKIEVFRVAMSLPDTKAESYSLITPEGLVIKQMTPYGFYFVRDPIQEEKP